MRLLCSKIRIKDKNKEIEWIENVEITLEKGTQTTFNSKLLLNSKHRDELRDLRFHIQKIYRTETL